VYATLCDKLVANACDGRTGCVMTYGQTGSGKTFTMMGDPHSFRNRGVLPRAVGQVFAHVASKPEREYSIYMSYLEVYGEELRDLLVEGNATNGLPAGTAEALGVTVQRGSGGGVSAGKGASVLGPGEFNIVDDPVHGVVVRGLTLVPVSSEAEVLTGVFQAELARTTATHSLNRLSSRAHSVFTLHIQQRSRLGSGREKVVSSKILLVDLAGSERIKKTMGAGPMAEGAEAVLQRESIVINRSLSYLEACVVALSSSGRTHVPYKNARLTQVLKDALGGSCNTTLIACIWGEARHLEECISTLKFAQRMMHVQNAVSEEQIYVDPQELLRKLQREVTQLKQELQMHDALAERTGVQYGDYTPEQQAQLAARVKAFMAARDDEGELQALPLESVQQMREALRQAKALVKQAAVEAEERLQQQFNLVRKGDASAAAQLSAAEAAAHSGAGAGAGAASASRPGTVGGAAREGEGGGYGVIDAAVSGIGIGLAAATARPGALQLPQSIVDRGGGLGSIKFSPFAEAAAGGGGGGGSGGSGGGGGGGGGASFSSFSAGPGGPALSPMRGGRRKGAGLGDERQGNIALDLNGAWLQFKSTPALGAESAAEATGLKRRLATSRDEAAMAVRAANEAKQRIETLSKMLVDLHNRPASAKTEVAESVVVGGAGGKAGAKPSSAKGAKPGSVASGAEAPEAAAAEAARRAAERAEEEKKMVAGLADSKHAYRAAVETLAAKKEACAQLQEQLAAVMAAMVRDFETWYASMTGRLPPIPVSPSRDRSGSPFKSGGRQQGFGATALYDWTAKGAGESKDDQLDDGEAFEKLELEKVTAHEPDSMAFFGATRAIRQGAKPTGGKRTGGGPR
jgi:hypothetical protein